MGLGGATLEGMLEVMLETMLQVMKCKGYCSKMLGVVSEWIPWMFKRSVGNKADILKNMCTGKGPLLISQTSAERLGFSTNLKNKEISAHIFIAHSQRNPSSQHVL